MTEHWFYLAVKAACYAYIIYKVWGWKDKVLEVCELLYSPKIKSNPNGNNAPVNTSEPDVMGGTRYVYLDKDAGQTVAPVLSEPMDMVPAGDVETDDNPLSEEVEHNLLMETLKIIGEEQKILDALPRDAETVTTEPVSLNDLILAGDVLMGIDKNGQDTEKQLRAAKTLHRIQGTDLFDIFVSQVENAELINMLIDRYLINGEMLNISSRNFKSENIEWNWKNLI